MRLLSQSVSALILSACVYAPVDLEGRGPPCIEGYQAVPEGDALICRPIGCLHCEGDRLMFCDGTSLACAAGCTLAPIAHCTLDEGFGLGDLETPPDGREWVLNTGLYRLDTSDGSLRHDGALVDTVGVVLGSDAWLWGTRSFTLAEDATLEVVGPRALAITALTSIVIEGTLDAGAHGAVAGPGARLSTDAQRGRQCGEVFVGGSSYTTGGGAGGSYASRGGDGGSVDCMGRASASTADDAVALTALRGGQGGGPGGNTCGAPLGGGGGGALLLAAGATIHLGGVLDASGGGGNGGRFASAGAGGGAGGALVLSASDLRVEGDVSIALGGGGGGAASCGTNLCDVNCGSAGLDGSDGFDDSGARGEGGGIELFDGGLPVNPRGSPGSSSSRDADPGAPGDYRQSAGGGGGAGWVVLRTRCEAAPDLSGYVRGVIRITDPTGAPCP